MSHWQQVDLLVNNAGVVYYGPTERMTPEQWDWLLQINLRAPIQLTRELLPHFLQQGEAHVLNVSSIAGLVGSPRLTAYHTSKFGLVGFTEAMRAEYRSRGIGFTALCPGLVETNLFEAALNGRSRKQLKKPPRWLTVSSDYVARQAIRAIRANRGIVPVSPSAHFLWWLHRMSPSLLHWFHGWRRKKNKDKSPTRDSGQSEKNPKHAA